MDARPSMTPDELLQAYFEGPLSPEEEAQFNAWLEADPSNWDEFVDQLDVHASLWEECVLSTAAERQLKEDSGPSRPPKRKAVALRAGAAYRRARPDRPYLVPAIAAAGALVFVTALVLFSGGDGRKTDGAKAVTRSPSTPIAAPVDDPKPLLSVKPNEPVSPPPPPHAPPRIPEEPPRPPAPPKEPPKPLPPPPEKPAPPEPPKPPPPKTEAALAKLERVEGDVFLLARRGRVQAKGGEEILQDEGVETSGLKSLAFITYPDRTRLEVAGESVVSELSERQGKRVVLAKGQVGADVSKQPADRPMTFGTPHGDATVLGTTLRLTVDSARTRLEVKEGKVKLTRDRKGIDVMSGHYAVAAIGVELAAKPSRVSSGLQALYLFTEGQGLEVHDTSGVGAPLDLRIRKASSVTWRATGLEIHGRTYVASPGAAAKVVEACRKSREVTVELWVKPAKSTSEFEGCLFALSNDDRARNLTLLQGDRADSLNLFAVWLRTTATDATGAPPLVGARGMVEQRLTHLMFGRQASGAEKLYVDGVERASRVRAGDLSVWSDAFRLCLATEGPDIEDERPWVGEYRLVAVYSRALSGDEVSRNHKSGVP